jgi:hypothetical protein
MFTMVAVGTDYVKGSGGVKLKGGTRLMKMIDCTGISNLQRESRLFRASVGWLDRLLCVALALPVS